MELLRRWQSESGQRQLFQATRLAQATGRGGCNRRAGSRLGLFWGCFTTWSGTTSQRRWPARGILCQCRLGGSSQRQAPRITRSALRKGRRLDHRRVLVFETPRQWGAGRENGHSFEGLARFADHLDQRRYRSSLGPPDLPLSGILLPWVVGIEAQHDG